MLSVIPKRNPVWYCKDEFSFLLAESVNLGSSKFLGFFIFYVPSPPPHIHTYTTTATDPAFCQGCKTVCNPGCTLTFKARGSRKAQTHLLLGPEQRMSSLQVMLAHIFKLTCHSK